MERFPRYPRAVADGEAAGRPANEKAEHVLALVNSIHNNLELLKKRGVPILMAETYELLDTLRDSLDIKSDNIQMLRKEFKFSGTKVAYDPTEDIKKEEKSEERERHEIS